MKKGSLKRLSFQELRFCSDFASGVNATQSYVNAYGVKDRRNAAVYAYAKLDRPKIQKEILRLKEGAGLTDEFIFKKIKDGLEATLTARRKGILKESAVPDYNIRHKYVDTAAKILRMFPREGKDVRNLNIDLQLEKMSMPEFSELLNSTRKKINVETRTKARVLKKGEGESGEKDL